MNIHFGNQSQFELFPRTTGDSVDNVAPRFIFSRIILTFENVVVIFVFVIVSLIVAFSLGVERGRVKTRVARAAAPAVSAPAMASVMPHPEISVAPVSKLAMVAVQPDAIDVRTVSPVPPVSIPPIAATPQGAVPRIASRTRASEKVVDKRYTIQVASYKTQTAAQREATVLQKQGLESFIVVKGNYVILCVGHYSGQDEAKEMLDKLKKRYKDSILRSL